MYGFQSPILNKQYTAFLQFLLYQINQSRPLCPIDKHPLRRGFAFHPKSLRVHCRKMPGRCREQSSGL